ncbi:hypothetical protein LTR85_010749 [Meristemomyces frigidus]|nr:hypothetical protein LTR85_010749 [Meristemomyces frigidus]
MADSILAKMNTLDGELAKAQIAGKQPFQYDVPRPLLIRTFRLVSDDPEGPLCGVLLSHSARGFGVLPSLNPLSIANNFREFLNLVDVFPDDPDPSGYDALSYTWGPASELYPLQVFALSAAASRLEWEPERSGLLYIRKSLREFLLEMRRREHDHFMWIDAVCIDQGSAADKAHHLAAMRYIYRRANKVLVWLGNASPEEEEAVQGLLEMTTRLMNVNLDTTSDDQMSRSLTSAGLPPSDSERWSSLRSLLTHSWWSRMWTLQEVAAIHSDAPTIDGYLGKLAVVFWGGQSTPWQVLEDFVTAVSRADMEDWVVTGRADTLVENKHAFDSIKEIAAIRDLGPSGIVSLKAVLQATRRREATLPADVILAQCGMLHLKAGGALTELQVDISSSAVDVFIAFAKYYLRQEMQECLLNHAVTCTRLDGLPSWCPDFACPPEAFCLGSRWLGTFKRGYDGMPSKELRDEQAYHAGFTRAGQWEIPYSRFFWGTTVWKNAVTMAPRSHGYYDTTSAYVMKVLPGTDNIRLSGIDVDVVTEVVDCNPGAEYDDFLNGSSLRETRMWDVRCLDLAMRTVASRKQQGELNGFEEYARTLVANRIRLFPAFNCL